MLCKLINYIFPEMGEYLFLGIARAVTLNKWRRGILMIPDEG